MLTPSLILAEIRFRTVNFVLCVLAVAIAAALFVIGPSLISGYARDTRQQLAELQSQAEQLQQESVRMQAETEALLTQMDTETKRIMRDLGVNLRIVHRDTNMGDLYTDFLAVDFPEDYVQRLAQSEHIETMEHVVATLQHKIKWKDRTVLLIGTLPVSRATSQKNHMAKNVEPGTALVGFELGAGLKEGDTIEIEGRALRVARIMPEYGSLEDVQLAVNLKDAQEILHKPGKINQIFALTCKCKGDRISVVRQELEAVLPDTKVTEHLTQAEAREKQRDLVEAAQKQELARVQANLIRIEENRDRQAEGRQRQEQAMSRLIGIMTPVVVLASALFVGLMTWLNVRERAAGYLGAPALGRAVMQLPAEFFQADRLLLVATLAGAPLITVLASYLPTLSAVVQDPSLVLMDS